MAVPARFAPRETNNWPGFVDALASLLMVIIFILMIFIISQFYLTQVLSGRDAALERLQRQVAELGQLLSLERESSAELRMNVAQLSAELQSSISKRDELQLQIGQLLSQREQLEDRLASAVSDRSQLRQRIVELEGGRKGIDSRLTQVLNERDALLGKLNAVEEEMQLTKAQRDEAEAGLADAFKVIAANRETIQLQLRDLESLRRDIAALRDVRKDLETQVAGLLTARQMLEDQVKGLAGQVAGLEGDKVDLAAALAKLAEDRDAVRKQADELKAGSEELSRQLAQAVAALGAERDRSKALQVQIADEKERTLLSQQEIDKRDIRLTELMSQYDLSQQKLTEEQMLSAAANEQVELLNQQLIALRGQLGALQEILDATEARNKEQQVQIVDLGKRLNQALATKVQELERFRSEFFGRLREILSNRRDIRVVGDRFVFQSEVLFASGSADIGLEGQLQLTSLAEALKEITPRIPANLNWILQVEGHTDRVPIFTDRFHNNWELSAARAISVVQFLISQGIPAARLAATGYGEFQPFDTGSQDLGDRRNRRIEMKLTQR
jgi:chemotaxis protein MotB